MKYVQNSALYVKRTRETLGLTQEGLAELLDLERRTIMRFEQGQYLPKQTRLAIRCLRQDHVRKRKGRQ